ncbi:MFS transporter [Pseudohoeflea sp. DP4N28-3]|uniref:MFS transporter n=1 Tax=Pseudohoeflea coraliihabitans TaxID=2860393 RepID=A0ABS6WQ60_9HYPH|nr:MFS transporter [Pseudohoeflea sp. DP4N28-3]
MTRAAERAGAPDPPSLRRAQLLAYALPALPLAALTLPLYVLVPTFYSETLGLPLAGVGLALLLVRLFDALSDPLLGWVADRIPGRLGRRRTLFSLGVPVAALASYLLFAPPPAAGLAWLTACGLALSLGYTATLIPYAAWGAELAGDYHERSRVAAWREGFTLIGTLLAIALPYAFGFATAGGWHGLAVLGLLVALALPLFGTVTVLRVPEPPDHTRTRLSFRAGLRRLARNRPFIRLVSAFFLNGLANGIPATLFLYFVSARLGLPEWRGPLLFLYFLCAIAGVPLALQAARMTSKHRAWALAMIVACIAFAPAPLLAGPEAGPAFAAITVITGLLLGFDLALPASIQADVIDVDTASGGEQRSGLYFALWSLATKLALALGVGIAFPLLAIAGFNPDAAAAGPGDNGVWALAIAYGWVPIAAKLTAIALMWNFPLDEAQQQTLRRRITAND